MVGQEDRSGDLMIGNVVQIRQSRLDGVNGCKLFVSFYGQRGSPRSKLKIIRNQRFNAQIPMHEREALCKDRDNLYRCGLIIIEADLCGSCSMID
jgi:hypothetical protein